MIEVYVKASQLSHLNIGSSGYLIKNDNKCIKRKIKTFKDVSASRLEYIAIFSALHSLNELNLSNQTIQVYMSNKLVEEVLNKHRYKWKMLDWHRNQSKSKIIKNVDLIRSIDSLDFKLKCNYKHLTSSEYVLQEAEFISEVKKANYLINKH